jgi:3-oxoacyl-[acyl-carrier protein] reductase
VQAFFDRIGAFDHLVFCAGEMLHLQTLEKMELDQARGFVNLRFWGAFMAVKYDSPHIRSGGSITLTNGVAGLRPQKGWTVAANICGAKEVRGRNITVNAVAPGPTATALFLDGKPQTVIDHLSKLAPLERLGQPEDIANAVSFLAGPDGAWINGQVLRANGGVI